MASRALLLSILLFLVSFFPGCARREPPDTPPSPRVPAESVEKPVAPEADASDPMPETAGAAPALMEDASSAIVYPDGALRRIYPDDYQLGAVATVETVGPGVETARAFLRSLVAGEVDPDLLLPESRFVLTQTLGRDQWPGIDGFRLGEPISMSQTVVALPVALFSQGRRGTTEVYVVYDGELWYISEFPVFPGMFARDDGANQPAELFDPRSPQL